MKVSQALEFLKNYGEDEDIYCFFFAKEEADNKGEEDLDEVDFRFKDSEWAKIVARLENDKGIYQTLDETFCEVVDQALEKRENDETN